MKIKKIEKEIATNVDQCITPDTFNFILQLHYEDLNACKDVTEVTRLFKAGTVFGVMRLSPYKVPDTAMGKEIVLRVADLLKKKM